MWKIGVAIYDFGNKSILKQLNKTVCVTNFLCLGGKPFVVRNVKMAVCALVIWQIVGPNLF